MWDGDDGLGCCILLPKSDDGGNCEWMSVVGRRQILASKLKGTAAPPGRDETGLVDPVIRSPEFVPLQSRPVGQNNTYMRPITMQAPCLVNAVA